MYHRVFDQEFHKLPDSFEKHFKQLLLKYKAVVPGDKLINRVSICLTFDDAYYDFYYYVFPLLKKYNVKAVLAVSPRFIVDKTELDSEVRLNVPHNDAMKGDAFQKKVPFCTWEELKEMVDSGHIILASHSYSHANMTDLEIDLKKETIYSRQIIKDKTGHEVNVFVYPYGKMNKNIHNKIIKHYNYIMRIGSALNYSWQNKNNCIYRFDAENYWISDKKLSYFDFICLYYKYLCNCIRKK